MSKGVFITFEGGEGVGKTTQIKRLQKSLQNSGHDVLTTREPGGIPAAEEIRTLLSHKDYGGAWTPEAELLLLLAARSMHIKHMIAPALEAGKIVICDRYIDSTHVYQGHMQNIDEDFMGSLDQRIAGNCKPDLTFILDLAAEKAMARVQERGQRDHYDRQSVEFYDKLRQGFLKIAAKNPQRCFVIDADNNEDAIEEDIKAKLTEKLGL